MFLFLKQPAEHASPIVQRQAKDSCTKSALEVARLCKIYTSLYGCSIMPNMWTQSISMSLYVLVEEVAASNEASGVYDAQILDLVICLRAMSRRWPMSMAILRMVQHDARSKGVTLPPEAEKLFEEFETRDWKTRETRTLVSMYPDPTGATRDRGIIQSVDMGKFLERMESMQLEDGEKS
jgi:hypothetical protein